MSLSVLYAQARRLGLGRITWEPCLRGGWRAYCEGLRFPHQAEGSTPLEALDELVRFARRVTR